MSAHGTTPAAGIGEGRSDHVGARSDLILPPAPDVARCRCCRHPLTAPTSVARGIGPECWRRRVLDSLRAAAGSSWHATVNLDGAGQLVRLVLEPTAGAER